MATGFSISIAAVDNATKVINGINKSLDNQQKKFNQITAPVRRLRDSFAQLGQKSGLANLTRQFGPMSDGIRRATAAMGQMLAPLGAITGAASAAGLSALVTQWSNFGRALNNNAALLGTTTSKLQLLEGVGQQFGMSAGDMTNGVRTLGNTLQDALMGRAPEAALYLQRLGINIQDSGFKAMTGAQQMDKVRDALSKIKDPLQQAALAQTLLGSSADAMLPYIRASKEQIAAYTAEAKKYVLTQEQTAGADGFARSLNLLQQSVTHFANVLSSALAPALGPVIEQVRAFIDTWATPENIKVVADYVISFGQALIDVGKYLLDSMNAIGGWKVALGGLIALQVGSWMLGIIAALPPIIAGFTALWALMIANPIGLTITAFAALAAGAVLIYKNWGPIKDFFADMWNSIVGYFTKGINAVKSILPGPVLRMMGLSGTSADNTVSSNTLGDPNAASSGPVNSTGMAGPGTAPAVASDGSIRGTPNNLAGRRDMPNGLPTGPLGNTRDERAATTMGRLMEDLHLTREQAAGFAGNFGHESGFTAVNEENPLIPGSLGGYGFSQSTGPRRVQQKEYARRHGLDPRSDEAQYGFILEELRGPYAHVVDAVRRTNNVAEATRVVQHGYEGGLAPTAAELPQDAAAGMEDRYKQANRFNQAGPNMTNPFVIANGTGSPVQGQVPNGQVTVNVNLGGNVPAGTTTTATASGPGVRMGPTRTSPMTSSP